MSRENLKLAWEIAKHPEKILLILPFIFAGSGCDSIENWINEGSDESHACNVGEICGYAAPDPDQAEVQKKLAEPHLNPDNEDHQISEAQLKIITQKSLTPEEAGALDYQLPQNGN